ncbi:hypothetical protein [Streptosporangium sp. NPDC000509]|uniref:hypothetical protein n=1 Tax=Streptosporangium sp. NPDC000509 TaxID=3366186 RepID=UPI0036CCD18C
MASGWTRRWPRTALATRRDNLLATSHAAALRDHHGGRPGAFVDEDQEHIEEVTRLPKEFMGQPFGDPPIRGDAMGTAQFEHHRLGSSALSALDNNPETAQVLAILALAAAVNRLAEAQEEANA